MSNTPVTTAQTSGGISTTSILGISFVILKLIHVIDWSWLWVLAPFWIPWAFVGSILALVGIVMGIAGFLDHRDAKKRRAARHVGRRPNTPNSGKSNTRR